MPSSTESAEYDDDVTADSVDAERDVHVDGPIYSHGYSLRVIMLGEREAALEALALVGWTPTASSAWRRCERLTTCDRWIATGSVYVSHRKPLNKGLAMAQFNAQWKTNLYSLIVDDDGRKIAITFHGVRRPDVERVLTGAIGLDPAAYKIDHYTALERYFVLAPGEAYRLAAKLEGKASKGYGRASRKRYLLRDHEFPVVVGQRAHRTARLTMYRLTAGATAQFKVELRLKGRSRDRQQFAEGDIPQLDAILDELIEAHQLHPVPKPARWEPVTPHGWRRDGNLAIISQKAYRGGAVDVGLVAVAQRRHTHRLVFSTYLPNGSLTSLTPEYIRQSADGSPPCAPTPACPPAETPEPVTEAQSQPETQAPSSASLPSETVSEPLTEVVAVAEPIVEAETVTEVVGPSLIVQSIAQLIDIDGSWIESEIDDSMIESEIDDSSFDEVDSQSPSLMNEGHRAWVRLADDINNYESYLSEVILDGNQDPAPCVQALIDQFGEDVGIGSLSYGEDGIADTWGSIAPLMMHRPLTSESKVLVILIDYSVVLAIEDCVYESTGDSVSATKHGPLYPSYWGDERQWGPAPLEKATAALLTPLFALWRSLAETGEGLRIVTITTDIRPAHGKGSLLPVHRYRDGRVRSHVGDAGRYHAHLRYLVDSDVRGRPLRVTLAKDEGEGLPGRMLWG